MLHAASLLFFAAVGAFSCRAIYATVKPRIGRIIEVLEQGL